MIVLVLIGCSSYGKTTDSQPNDPITAVEVNDEPEIEVDTLPQGCVSTIKELEFPYHVNAKDQRLLADRLIVVRKEARRMMLFSDGQLRHDRTDGKPDCWRIGLGWEPIFDKVSEGDGRTPEGFFATSDKPWSSFYGAIAVHYPSERHAAQALARKLISKNTHDQIVSAHKKGSTPPQSSPLGGNILIHGGGSSSDWTLGCIALSNHDIDELRALLPNGMKTWMLILP